MAGALQSEAVIQFARKRSHNSSRDSEQAHLAGLAVKQETICFFSKFLRPAAGTPMMTPKRRRSSSGREAALMPALANASVEAQSARGSMRETCLRSFFSTQESSSNSATSPVIWTSMADESKREMRRTPLRPVRAPSEKAAVPIPLGLTTPIPVITQRPWSYIAVDP